MIDIVGASADIELFDTDTSRAANILSTQLGALEYAQDLGVDLRYFLDEKFKFQNSSFKAYLVEVLANRGISVTTVMDQLENLYATYTFELSPQETSTGLVV